MEGDIDFVLKSMSDLLVLDDLSLISVSYRTFPKVVQFSVHFPISTDADCQLSNPNASFSSESAKDRPLSSGTDRHEAASFMTSSSQKLRRLPSVFKEQNFLGAS